MNGSSESIPREEWFYPPEGILEGTKFDIAFNYITRQRIDIAYYAENPFDENPEAFASRMAAYAELEEMLAGYETRLDEGDVDLASSLTWRVEREVRELNSGMRETVTGEAHLMTERLQQVGHIWGVRIEGNPVPPHLD